MHIPGAVSSRLLNEWHQFESITTVSQVRGSRTMQIHRNRIVIRERGLLDILDLALCVIRSYAWPLTVALALGVGPAMALNAWLLADLAEPAPSEPAPWAYLWCMLFLVLWEAPMATAPATLFLGEAVFQERPHVRNLVRSFVVALPQLFWYQVIWRAMLIPIVVTWCLPFAAWPYLNEVILLERNPLRRRPNQITTFRRSRALHGGSLGDLAVRWLVTTGFGILLFFALWCSMNFLEGLLVDEWSWEAAAFTVYYPLALWIVVGYFTVVRFLGYLDLRIRREGWEVELMMRTEGARLARQLSMSTLGVIGLGLLAAWGART
jgi:hypothetical protein